MDILFFLLALARLLAAVKNDTFLVERNFMLLFSGSVSHCL